MKFDTLRWGTVEVEDTKLLRFEGGLPGFGKCERFVVMEHDRDTPLKWLQSVDRPEVAFLVVEPEQVLGSFEVDVPEPVLRRLGFEGTPEPKQIGLFLILNAAGEELYANLRAPVIVNMDQRRAVQLIRDDPDLPVHARIAPRAAGKQD